MSAGWIQFVYMSTLFVDVVTDPREIRGGFVREKRWLSNSGGDASERSSSSAADLLKDSAAITLHAPDPYDRRPRRAGQPAASWFVNHNLPRWAATTLVFTIFLALMGAFVAAAIPPLAQQATELIRQAPHYLQQAQDHSSAIGRLNDRFHLQQRITENINGSSGSVVSDVVSAGSAVFGALADSLVVIVLTVYFLVDMPRIRTNLYRMVPHTRRPRAILIGDEVFAKVGAYVLGNVLISVIAGGATFIWLLAFNVPYPLLLGIFVALFDLVPVVGSTIAGVGVAAVALTVSLPVCIATTAFFVVFRLLEDYLLVPRIIGRVVKVPALITVVAVLIGGALLGIVGALVAIPIAAALQLLIQEVLYPRLDEV